MIHHPMAAHSPYHRGKFPRGAALLHDPVLNKGTAFTEAERDAFGLHGLLPPHVATQDEQVARVMDNVRRKPNDLEKYIQLIALLDRNQQLFYRVVMDHIEEMIPILYTPTVGQACREYGHIFRRSRGLYLCAEDRGRIAEILANWPFDEVGVVVVTDGERILGLGDLGASGMGIPVGKLNLYCACAGIDPSLTLPVTIDVGTNNQSLLDDPLYLGLRHERLRGEAYDATVDEFIRAVTARFPDALIQFEDFGKGNAFRLLNRYRDKIRTFNDDIQGTAAVVLSGLWTALGVKGGRLTDQTILFLGAGGAGVGIASLIVSAMVHEGLSEEEARARCWMVDSRGLVTRGRAGGLEDFKRPFAHVHEPCPDLPRAVKALRPTVLIGASGQAGAFTPEVLRSMAANTDRPIVMALSNPTTKAECTAEEAYAHTGGKVLFASGSPFPAFTYEDRTIIPGQGNNAYIFPGVGLGVLVSGARHVTDEMFFAAARALSDQATDEDLAVERLYPPLSRIRDVSAAIATAVAREAQSGGLATKPLPEDLEAHIRSHMYVPDYPDYLS